MEITFLGVGEACDPAHPNTSILLYDSQRKGSVLLDCGFTTPHQYFSLEEDPDALDILWISHFHGDHFFGVPLLLLRFWEGGRKKPLFVVGQNGVEEIIRQTLELAYPGFDKYLAFPLHFVVLAPGEGKNVSGFLLHGEENDHSRRCLALVLEQDNKKIFYSGDGRPTVKTCQLATGSDLLIHEAFRLHGDTPGHGSIEACIDFAVRAKAKRLALVHINHKERAEQMRNIQAVLAKVDSPVCFVPESGSSVIV